MAEKDAKAHTNWLKSSVALENYSNYIKKKIERQKFDLTLIDLLYISNFKGGNATINEEESIINSKLKAYSNVLIKIDASFDGKFLSKLKEDEVFSLIKLVEEFVFLSKKEETCIDGFKSSYLSALLHSYFPNLIPILDRRLLINLGLVNEEEKHLNNQKQVKKIEIHYPKLIKVIYEKSKSKSIRELDAEFFKIKLPDWANRKSKK